ncbi:MAG: hypothetical protein OEZ01_01280, partial [Candidatus Heimdallarchaeota archaeon]|nr:hypothetical protein [Candidatus Heimdallarchaeota archaeon]
MKLLSEFPKDGKLQIIAQDSEDLYRLYNVISPSDLIIGKTTRRIKSANNEKESSERQSMIITLEVDKLEFQGFGEAIRVRGKIKEASEENVSIGSHHSMNIDLFQKITIIKSEWSKTQLEDLRNSQLGDATELYIVVMDDESVLVSQVGSHASRIILEGYPTITRKGSDPNQHQKDIIDYFINTANFMKDIYQNKETVQFIISGVGFLKENFYDFIKSNYPHILKMSTLISIKSSGRAGIREVLTYHLPENINSGKNAKEQAQLIEQIMEYLGTSSNLIAYASDVYLAAEIGAIDKLLILDSKLHENLESRKKIENLRETTYLNGGKTYLMSSMYDNS